MSAIGSIKCPGCNNKVIQKGSDGSTSMRPGGSVRFVGNSCFMSCHFCKRDLELPVRIEKSEGSEVRILESARLVIRK